MFCVFCTTGSIRKSISALAKYGGVLRLDLRSAAPASATALARCASTALRHLERRSGARRSNTLQLDDQTMYRSKIMQWVAGGSHDFAHPPLSTKIPCLFPLSKPRSRTPTPIIPSQSVRFLCARSEQSLIKVCSNDFGIFSTIFLKLHPSPPFKLWLHVCTRSANAMLEKYLVFRSVLNSREARNFFQFFA